MDRIDKEPLLAATLMGAVYGDIAGAPYMTENTYNRYFELGVDRSAYSNGRVKVFHPRVTEVSHAASTVAQWLFVNRDSPDVGQLQDMLRRELERHPQGAWTQQTRLFLSSPGAACSESPDWAASARAVPVASFMPDDLQGALDLSDMCVMATCRNEDAIRMARALTECAWLSSRGEASREDIAQLLSSRYALDLSMTDEDLRCELRGEVRVPLEMMGTPVEGAYRYVPPSEYREPGAMIVTTAALKAVLSSDGWEDAVRRAVSYGGPSNGVAAMAGGLAASMYGEVTPAVVGRLFAYIPTDIASRMESLERSRGLAVHNVRSPHEALSRDAVTIIGLSEGDNMWVVPQDRPDIERIVRQTYQAVRIVRPETLEATLSQYAEGRSGTYPYGVRPERRTLYLQDGHGLVSPSRYVAPGMPPLQQRQAHLREFTLLKAWCRDRQREMNRLAGNPEDLQIHYGSACHMWIGSRTIDFLCGDILEGRVSLDSRGLLKVDLGEYRDLSADSRFEDHHMQAWASRGIFSIQDTVDPLGRLSEIREEISSRLFDEGAGSRLAVQDMRSEGEDEMRGLLPVGNLSRINRISEEDMRAYAASVRHDSPLPRFDDAVAPQPVDMIYSIGLGSRSRDSLVNMLRMTGVDTVVDLRSVQHSKYVPQFNPDALMDALEKCGARYIDGSDKLGDNPSDLTLYSRGILDWDRAAGTEQFRSGIEAIRTMMRQGHMVALISSESDPLKGHRFGLVGRALTECGLDVRHVMPGGEIRSHKALEAVMAMNYGRQNRIDMIFRPFSLQIYDSYRALNEDHGKRLVRHGRAKSVRHL